MKGEWKCVIVDSGVPSVMRGGITEMQKWSAASLVLELLVCYHSKHNYVK